MGGKANGVVGVGSPKSEGSESEGVESGGRKSLVCNNLNKNKKPLDLRPGVFAFLNPI